MLNRDYITEFIPDLEEFREQFKGTLGSYQFSNVSDLFPNKGTEYLRMYGELYKEGEERGESD